MKPDIHPKFYETEVSCVCGNRFIVGSPLTKISVEICNACHPVFLGGDSKRLIDTEGRVERFNRRMAKAAGQ